MFEMLYGFDAIVSGLLFLCWGISAILVRRLPFQVKRKKFLLILKFLLLAIIAAEFFVILKVAIAMINGIGLGWEFAENMTVGSLTFLIPVSFFTAVYFLPRIARTIRNNGTDVIQQEERKITADQFVQIPIRFLAVVSFASLFIAFVPLVDPMAPKVTLLFGFYVASILYLYTQNRRLTRALEHSQMLVWPRFSITRFSLIALSIVIGSGALFFTAKEESKLPGVIAMSHEISGHTEHSVSVTELKGLPLGVPDRRITLRAEKKQVTLSSGTTIEAWTFNGELPGPEIQVRQGEVLEVKLINKDIEDGVSIHWHGVNVPNAMDGVAGVTQDAVQPGETFIYKFRADQAGTFWYHSHQQSSKQVRKGLFGSLIIEPKEKLDTEEEISVVYHNWETKNGFVPALGLYDTLQKKKIKPGKKVRLRLINADNLPRDFILAGTAFQVVAIDGNNINKPSDLKKTRLSVAGGGRMDVEFIMPDHPVKLIAAGEDFFDTPDVGILFSKDGSSQGVENVNSNKMKNYPVFKPEKYGSPLSTPFDLSSSFDREFKLVFDSVPGFYDGEFHSLYTINGKVFPKTDMLEVEEGDLVKTTFVNRSFMDHPMHLHGHHMLVLSRNGKKVTGSPWWTDTLNVAPGETYEVAFLANNPGIWMDHCHNLDHAEIGMTLHLNYKGVTTPFEIGKDTPNQPE
ncbi:multicopper oxidase family protein [Bacillus litorisediminis]|uniref:multicopper oxidase family protein n=1 Tax=Bacillus litorisediminis TaxID=2922713 RepID=UPI001FACD33A|nr:multicopper oxidase family protein [Bacillus litorisediminis]